MRIVHFLQGEDTYSYYSWSDINYYNETCWCEKINDILVEKFASLKWYDDRCRYFSFDDVADEAAFLLWSAGGIEI
jgi:hypothetical protein